jgi:hypothetical protein
MPQALGAFILGLTKLRIVDVFLISTLVIVLAGCSLKAKEEVKAVYLIGDEQQLSAKELEKHPEISVVKRYDDMKEVLSKTKTAIWIDKSAVSMIDDDWLHQAPQKYYPLVIVGYNDPLFSFRDTLSGFGIEGPYVDWSKEKIEPGFSLWCIIDETDGHKAAFKGFDEVPTVERILNETAEYLK